MLVNSCPELCTFEPALAQVVQMYFVTLLWALLTTGNSCTTAANFHTTTYLRQDICINRLQQKMLVNLFRCNLRTSGKSLCSCVVQLLSMYIHKSSSIVHINARRQALLHSEHAAEGEHCTLRTALPSAAVQDPCYRCSGETKYMVV